MKLFIYIITLGLSLTGCTHTDQYAVPAPKPIEVVQLAKSTQSWNGATLPVYKKGQPEVTILEITVQPGTKLPLHTHPVINAGLLLEGELTVIQPGKHTLVLKAGDAIVEMVDLIHYGTNTGDVPAKIVVFYAGIADEPITIKTK